MDQSATKQAHVKPRRRWLSFGLRGLMGLILVIAVLIAWLGQDGFQARYEQATVKQIGLAGGTVTWSVPPVLDPYGNPGPEPTTYERTMKRIFGEEVFYRIGFVEIPAGAEEAIVRLSKLEKLTDLIVGSGSISDTSIEAISQLDQLQVLSLNNTQITPVQLKRLVRLPKLRRIELAGGSATQSNIAALASFSQVNALKIDSRPFVNLPGREQPKPSVDEKVLIPLARLKQVQSLELVNFTITEPVLTAIGGMQSLKYLGIDDYPSTGDIRFPPHGLESWGALEQLEAIYLSTVPLEDHHLKSLSQVSSLTAIECDGTQITDVGLTHLIKLPHPRFVGISGCQVTEETLLKYASAHPGSSLDIGEPLPANLLVKDGRYGKGCPERQEVLDPTGKEVISMGHEPGGFF
ncbi:leucine-rich repeat domain-containing protein [Blastopirellula marina]|uniref:Leucine-rich repeat domain-containing protein n=1 Tax=Blastopirellula marina TaxID=124 RepID=A0A2S8GPC2_9BACT|nr:leucine-rich repeat domain-containing protein [Blastopirellula marina]PQO46278.1 hypothetical protein C5Y93_09840 [Blastopirellula marina]